MLIYNLAHPTLDTYTYHYDSLYNPAAKDEKPIALSPPHALLRQDSHAYDLNGNTIYHYDDDEEEFLYDPLNRLITVFTNNTQNTHNKNALAHSRKRRILSL